MKVTSSRLAATAVAAPQYPQPPVPAIAFVGRSNVGKSSLINRLLLRKDLARTSSTPGKTAVLNFYRVNERFDLVDLPGYGHASVSRAAQAGWVPMIETFLQEYEGLAGVVQVVDLRHPPSPLDLQMFTWLQANGLPTVLVATKADKLGRSQWAAQRKAIMGPLMLEGAGDEVVMVASAETGEARDRIWTALGGLLAGEFRR